MTYVDVCIVGSGFGGSIAAARLGEYARQNGLAVSIALFEKGHDFFDFDPATLWQYRNAQGNGFQQSNRPEYSTELLNVATDPVQAIEGGAPQFSIVGGRGLGGGSLVYYGVSLRAPTATFGQTEAGRSLWPKVHSRAALDPYYARVEQSLRVCRLAWDTSGGAPEWQLCTRRDFVFAEGCLKIGATAEPLKVATQNDANEGWWQTGQRFGGRQHLPVNYLPRARAAGVFIQSECEVLSIAPSGKGYALTIQDNRTGSQLAVECGILVLSGGVVGSTGLLLRSTGNFTGARALGNHLGLHVSGNGDYGVVGIVGPGYSPQPYKGKPMSSLCASFWDTDRFLLIPYYQPPITMAFGLPAQFAYPANPTASGRSSTGPASARLWGEDYKSLMRNFGDRIMAIGILAWDSCEGVVKLVPARKTAEQTQQRQRPQPPAELQRQQELRQVKQKDPLGLQQVVVDWPATSPETDARWARAVQVSRSIYQALGGEMLLDAYRGQGSVGSVHPLGGCRMADTPDAGVVDPYGEVFGNPNLFVLDGSIVPSALGVNPSLTISALTELACDRLTEQLEQRLGA